MENTQFNQVYNHLEKLFGTPKTSLTDKIIFDVSKGGTKSRTAQLFKGKNNSWLVGSSDSQTVRNLLNISTNFVPLGYFIKYNNIGSTPVQVNNIPTKGLSYINSLITVSNRKEHTKYTVAFYKNKFGLTTDKQLLNLEAVLQACNTYTISNRALQSESKTLTFNIGKECLYSIGTFLQDKIILQTTALRNNIQEAAKFEVKGSNSTKEILLQINQTSSDTFTGQSLLNSTTQIVVLCEGANDCIAGNLLFNSLNNPFTVFITKGGTNHKLNESDINTIKELSPNAKIVCLFDHDEEGQKAANNYLTKFAFPVRLWSSLILPFGLTPVLEKGFDISDFYKHLNTHCNSLTSDQKKEVCNIFKRFVIDGK